MAIWLTPNASSITPIKSKVSRYRWAIAGLVSNRCLGGVPKQGPVRVSNHEERVERQQPHPGDERRGGTDDRARRSADEKQDRADVQQRVHLDRCDRNSLSADAHSAESSSQGRWPPSVDTSRAWTKAARARAVIVG